MKEKWLNLVGELSHYKDLLCPYCGKRSIDYLYIGDENTKIGYLQVWCNECENGIYVSRVKIPPNAKFVTFEDAKTMKLPSYKKL